MNLTKKQKRKVLYLYDNETKGHFLGHIDACINFIEDRKKQISHICPSIAKTAVSVTPSKPVVPSARPDQLEKRDRKVLKPKVISLAFPCKK
jgi:hypothetical protein